MAQTGEDRLDLKKVQPMELQVQVDVLQGHSAGRQCGRRGRCNQDGRGRPAVSPGSFTCWTLFGSKLSSPVCFICALKGPI